MPWHVAKSSSCPVTKPWAVIKDTDGSKVACHPTKDSAVQHMKALYANEPSAAWHWPSDPGPARTDSKTPYATAWHWPIHVTSTPGRGTLMDERLKRLIARREAAAEEREKILAKRKAIVDLAEEESRQDLSDEEDGECRKFTAAVALKDTEIKGYDERIKEL